MKREVICKAKRGYPLLFLALGVPGIVAAFGENDPLTTLAMKIFMAIPILIGLYLLVTKQKFTIEVGGLTVHHNSRVSHQFSWGNIERIDAGPSKAPNCLYIKYNINDKSKVVNIPNLLQNQREVLTALKPYLQKSRVSKDGSMMLEQAG